MLIPSPVAEIWIVKSICIYYSMLDMNIYAQDFMWPYALISLGKTPGSGIDETSSTCRFNFILNCQTFSKEYLSLYIPPSMT